MQALFRRSPNRFTESLGVPKQQLDYIPIEGIRHHGCCHEAHYSSSHRVPGVGQTRTRLMAI